MPLQSTQIKSNYKLHHLCTLYESGLNGFIWLCRQKQYVLKDFMWVRGKEAISTEASFFCSSLDSIFCLQSMFSARLKLPKRFMKICGRKLRKTKKTLRCDVKTEVYEVSTSMIK